MTGKDWIDNVTVTLQEKQEHLRHDNERLMTLRAEVLSVTAIQYDADKVQTTCAGDKLAQKYALMDEISKRMLRGMEEYNIYKSNSIHKLHKMIKHSTLSYCLEARHIDFKNNATIATELNMSERQVIRKFNKAYDLLNSIYILEKYRKCSEKVDMSPQDVVV